MYTTFHVYCSTINVIVHTIIPCKLNSIEGTLVHVNHKPNPDSVLENFSLSICFSPAAIDGRCNNT